LCVVEVGEGGREGGREGGKGKGRWRRHDEKCSPPTDRKRLPLSLPPALPPALPLFHPPSRPPSRPPSLPMPRQATCVGGEEQLGGREGGRGGGREGGRVGSVSSGHHESPRPGKSGDCELWQAGLW
jgi:hypothetical protein